MSRFFRKDQLLGKRIVDVLSTTISSNGLRTVDHFGLVLEDSRGRRTCLRWVVVEETDGADYGLHLIYPAVMPA